MFAVHCAACDARTMIWPSLVDGVRNTDAGVLVAFHCAAGHRGVLLTGRHAEDREAAVIVDLASAYATAS